MRLVALALFVLPAVLANTISVVTLDTAPLIGNASGPFTLDFQFIEGDGLGDSNNSITLSDFAFGGGSVSTPASSSTGGITVTNSPFVVTLVDSSFFQDVEFAFTPGSALSFQFDATSNVDTVAPDTFTFAILDNTLTEIPTTNPNGFDTFLEVDLPTVGSGTQIISSGTDLTQTAIDISAPDVEPGSASSTPEPSSVCLAGAAFAMAFFGWRSSRRA
jgi:hypothetical protein